MIWFVFACLLLVAVWFVVQPLLRPIPSEAGSASSLGVYRAQLSEVDADLERGLINAAEAESARIEIKRRILALDAPSTTGGPSATARPIVIGIGLVFAGVVVGVYLNLGRPGLAGQPFVADRDQAASSADDASQIDAMIEKLVTHLKSNKEDAEGWRALGWARIQLGQTEEGVEALKQAAELAPTNVSILSMYGEGLVRLAQGDVNETALAAFEKVLSLNPKDPRARFYKGFYLSRRGQEPQALKLWIEIIRDSPPDAEWLPAIRAAAKALAEKAKLDPSTIP